MTQSISLSQGKCAIVDDADFEWLNQWQWTAQKSRSTWYAVRTDYQTEPPTGVYMHRLILQTPSESESHHLNRDGLDNRRSNLVSCQSGYHKQYHQSERDERAKRLCDFGTSLNFERIGRDLTLTELEALSGIASSTLSQIERGQTIPYNSTINRLKEILPGPWRTPANAQLKQVKSRGLGKRAGMTSRYVGVSWCRSYQRWRAEIRVNYKLIYLGRFDSEEEAATVWNAEALKRRGPKAKLNIIQNSHARGSRGCGALCATPLPLPRVRPSIYPVGRAVEGAFV